MVTVAAVKKEGDPIPEDDLIDLPGGTFTMGSPKDEHGHSTDETLHRVCVSPFEIATTEVTVAQYYAVTGERPRAPAA